MLFGYLPFPVEASDTIPRLEEVAEAAERGFRSSLSEMLDRLQEQQPAAWSRRKLRSAETRRSGVNRRDVLEGVELKTGQI
jgi:hypothetical protein